jgi:ParB/RepB/Spo0J family partition protein
MDSNHERVHNSRHTPSTSVAEGSGDGDTPNSPKPTGRIVSVSPFRCRMWEIESFSRHGQLVAALGRPLRKDPDYDVELIFGARRLFVARHLNQPLLVELREMSGREAITAMDIENRHRADISPYERGLSYARWLRAGFFACQEDIARALKVSCSHVSRLLKIARLSSPIPGTLGGIRRALRQDLDRSDGHYTIRHYDGTAGASIARR